MTRNMLIIICLLAASACSAPDGATESAPATESKTMDIQSQTWRLSRLGDKAMPDDEKAPTLSFDAAASRLTGFAGCNRYFGDYKLAGTKLTLGPVGSTKRLCDQAAMAIEDRFLAALSGGTLELSAADQVLTLKGSGGESLEFAAAKAEP